MSQVKLAVVYYSATGTNYKLAKAAEEGAVAAGAEVRVVRVQELAPEAAIASNPAWKAHADETHGVVPVATLDDLVWADAIIFSFATRFGAIPAQLKQFLDTTGGLWFQGKLVNKVVSAMSSAQNMHGGQEASILSLYTTLYHWGAIVATPGYTDPIQFQAGGNPYGVSATVDQQGNFDPIVLEAAKVQARRVVTVASWVKQGMNG
ncbi:NAD(P)H:quinone oxidoreductase type IV [Paenibacillus filicis]|uniref:NAD(P)H:quinone oxidoreductase type IV n=1 Tax=Paenibacillus gyeongsangnamensis TaxID=3388067 RepID=A0ABT4QBP0_9BACL|nr:NAD(P)H:quinone oxidoreductase type IV [Paenibacillus filicis]MCZ8514276.1 NAD(P)H:quinone oxidoreductase type IV [Paenibacillus filicis]